MKPSTTDQVTGKLHEVKGAVIEKAGQVTNNPDVAAKGQAEKLAGKVQKKVGEIETGADDGLACVIELAGHQPQGAVNAAKKRNHPSGILLLDEIVDIQKRVTDQLHPQLFDLVHDLKLHFVRIAQLVVVELAGEQRLRAQVHLVVERPVAAHNRVKLFSIHVRLLHAAASMDEVFCI